MEKNKIYLVLKRSAVLISITLIILGIIYIAKTNLLLSHTKISKATNAKAPISNRLKNSKIQKIAYLTFEDGPSPDVTPHILDILKTYDAKATFFVTGKNSIINKLTLVKEAQSGNTIAIKSFDNNTKKIYSSPSSYINDINECTDILNAIIGNGKFNSKLVRFPGGSTMVDKNFIKFIKKGGYNFIDWNIDSKDAIKTKHKLPTDIVNTVKASCKNNNSLIILLHDTSSNEATSQALPEIIQFLKSQNYALKALQ
ncbi:polysaccharide deacetylase family protein [Clostridium felsineum]|uniref:polysaccharide deacetylase family protein n=1 Tax=Clostridium felsineum TaxID=36839 RepID=UPI00098C05DE|nr:polysaccharide deacetylase family protein [Clostridium felsineum]URZ01325.1 hypothetical protein CLAUR_013150 [Clostridium felsineum]